MTGFFGQATSGFLQAGIHKSLDGHSVTQRNIIPACANLVTMVTDFAWGFMSDMTGNRPLWIIGPLRCTTVVGSSILTAYSAADAARVAGFFLASCGYVTAVTWTWANEVNNGNAEERALTISSMNGLFYATNSFLPILIFPQTMAPKFERGFPSILGFALAAVALVYADFLHKRQLRQEADAAAEQPAAETKAADPDEVKEQETENKLSAATEPVRSSSTII
ncbi:Pantothenate transporter liz1 [Colletotrichum trifolii]|uniref:Pantothenate transporter liz1 n=1 Tax=Colletotrichum trifolii TaxID=5466 RepID=A0A4R8RRD6_COLTR|nr:Pantothenate transporter liz1 [Colletotrichum trifolii]